MVDDSSPNPEVREVLQDASANDPRIRIIQREVNGGIVTATNQALEAAAGEFVVLLDHDDLLTPDALQEVSVAIDADPDADYLYSDEDKLAPDGTYFDRFRKPIWSPERLLGQMYTGHLSTLRSSLVRAVGGFRPGYEGSQDHDLVLRVTEHARRIVHIPKVLYHWRVVPGSAAGSVDAKPYAWEAGRKAVQDAVDRRGIDAEVELGRKPGTYQVRRRPVDAASVISIVIPTKGSTGYVWGEKRCYIVEMVRSLLQKCGGSNLELVVVYDSDTPSGVLAELRELAADRLVTVEFEGAFNYSEKCNLGFLRSRGSVVVFMNDDMEAITEESVGILASALDEPGIGMVGAKLLHEDGSVQHAGLAFHGSKHLMHMYLNADPNDPGWFHDLQVSREVSGLTGACVAVRRADFLKVGGFCEYLPVNFNDVDLSLKIRRENLRLVWLAGVQFYHFESKTRLPRVEQWEYDQLTSRWWIPIIDPYSPEYRG